MYQINIHQAKTQLSKLVEEAAEGEEIIIANAGKPLARLVALEKIGHKNSPARWFKRPDLDG